MLVGGEGCLEGVSMGRKVFGGCWYAEKSDWRVLVCGVGCLERVGRGRGVWRVLVWKIR